MTDQNPYLRLVESQAASDEAMLRESIYTAKDANPDLTARALPIAGKLNLPASEVERDVDGYEKQAAFESNDYLRIVNDYPSLSRFLRDTENAKLAHDDIGALTSIFDVVGRAPAGGVVEAAGGSVRGAGALLEAGSVATDRYVNPYVAPGLYLLSKLGGASAPDLQEAGAAVQEFGRETVMPPQSRQNIGTDIGSGVGQVAAYIASSLVSPFAPLALGATQGAGIQAERADKAGAEPGEKAAAVAVGAVVTAATERIQLGVLMKGIPGMNKLLAKLPPAIQNKWLNRLIDVGAAGASEATQETVEGFLQDTVEHFAYNPDVEFFNEWEREAIAAGGAGSIARAVVATVTGRRGGTRGGQETQQTAEAVNEAVAASKLRQRAPEKFREAIAGAMAGENVYINAEGAQTFYQSLDPEAQARLNAAMPDLKEKVDAAAETGADVVIDRADYMAYVAGSEEAKSLAEFVKFSASDLSAFDEKQILEQMNAIQDDGDVAIDPNALDDIEAIERRIYDMLIQTEESGRADFARTQAQLVNLRALVAQAKGDPAQEARLLEIFRGLTIQRASRLRDVPRDNMDEFINTTRKAAEKRRKQEAAPSEKDLLGDTKKKRGKRAPTPIIRLLGELGGIDQSNPVAAELKAIGVTPKTHPRLFKKGSKLRFDALPVSEIRSALADRNIEPADDGNGYVDPDWLLEQIRAESFGEGALTPKQQEAAERDRQMDELEAVLDAAGLDIETATNAEIKAAIEGVQGVDGQALYQSAGGTGRKIANATTYEAIESAHQDIAAQLGLMPDGSGEIYNRDGKRVYEEGAGIRSKYYKFADGKRVRISGHSGGSQYEKPDINIVVDDGVATVTARTGLGSGDGRGQVVFEEDYELHTSPKVGGFGGNKEAYGAAVVKAINDGLAAIGSEARLAGGESGTTLYQNDTATPFDEAKAKELTARAKELTGTTLNPNEAGYITMDGEMLDLSGRHYATGYELRDGKYQPQAGKPDYLKNSRGVDHREVSSELMENGETQGMLDFITQAHAVRVDFNSGYVNATFVPSDKQIAAIVSAAKRAGLTELNVEHGRPDGRGLISQAYVEKITPRNIKRVFTESLFNETLFQGGGVKGQFETFSDGTSVITAFQGQNLSTVLHELGHFYSYLLRDMSTRFPDSAWTKEWEAVSGWWQENAKSILKEARTGRYYRTEKDAASGRYVVRGPYGRTLGSYKTKREAQSEADAQHMNLTVELTGMTEEDVRRVIQEGAKTTAEGVLHIAMEEHFARGFEAYLMEGKAPSMELKRAFRRFKAWLVGIYKDVKNLRVTLSPEIRGVFDRLLATEEQIETMRRLETFQLDPATAAILNSAERERAQRQAQEGVEWAKERLLKDLLREERQKALETYKAERAKLLEENTAMLRDSALYKAQAAMAAGGAGAAVVADLNGFTSVDEMQKALASLEPLEAKAERMTDEEMTARHGDMLKDGTIERAAVDRLMEAEAFFDKAQAELRAASDKAGIATGGKEALKALAQKMHDGATVRDATQATRYMRAAVKAARMYGAAAKAGKWDEAAKWKRQQILNQRLYGLARETQDFIDKSFRKWGRLTKKNAADAARVIDVEYLNAIRAILGRYGIGRGSFDINRWLLNIKDADPDLYDQLSQVVEVHSQQAKPYKSLTVDEFYELAAAVDNLIGVEKRRKEVEVLGKKVLVDEAVDQIAQSIETNFKPLPQTQEGRAKFGFKASREWGRYLGLFKMMETYVQAMDGGQVTGTVHKFLRSEILQAESAFVKRSMESAKEFDEIAEKYYKDESLADRKDAISIPQIGDSYTRLEIITVALNSGNEGNLDRLRDGRGWKDEQIDAVLSYMREKDWQFVQDVWRMINKRWPSIAKDHRERYGYIPAKVQPLSAVRVTADGKTVDVEGGYFPIAYDAELSAAAAQAETQQSLKDFGPVRYAKAQTRQGHKKERASTVKGRPLNLNGLAVISRHLNQVDYDLSMGKAIEDVNKIIRHPRFQKAVTDYMGADVYQDFDLWLKDTAVGPLYSDTSWLGRKARWLRTTYTGTRLALRFATFAVQFTGLTNSIVGVGPKWMGIGLQQFTKLSSMGDPFGAYKAVREKSVFMETNFATLNRDIGDTVAKLEGKSGKVAKFNKAFLFPMMGAQYTVNTITWLGAYNRGLAEGMPEAEAIRYADLQVERTQGSGLVSTLSKIQRGTLGPNIRLSEFVKVWTTLRSYFYTKMNLAMQRTRQTAQNPTPKEVTRLLGDYMLLFWIEAIVADFLLGRLPDDEDDDEAALGMYLLNAGATTAAAGAPGLDLLYGKTQGFESTPASARVIDDTATLLTDIPKIFDGERDPNWYSIARHSVTAGAYGVKGATGLTLPAAQINDYIRGLEKAANGEDASVLDYLRYSDD